MVTTGEGRRPGESGRTAGDGTGERRFAAPAVSALYVERQRLTTRLDDGADLPLTLVSAPAGSGKTALAAAWVAQGGDRRSVGWVACEPGDDRPAKFWSLVVGCLERCGVSLPRPRSPGARVSHRRMLTELSAALAGRDRPLHLVLDGLEITDRRLADDLEFVLAHTGRRLRLVVLTRMDPVLPLHRFRLDRTMVELRMSDLAFTAQETSELLGRSGVRLGDEAIEALLGRTRGWAVGLRFATMVLAGSEDPVAAVHQLAGDRGNIAEYLMAEMLTTQSPDVRTLMLRTSVVDLLEPGLIEELGGRSAPRTLDALARSNVLVEEVPERPGSYRYQPLLRDLLRAELGYASPGLLTRMQRRAASWYAGRGRVEEAVSLAAASGAWTEAARYAVAGLAVGRLAVGNDDDRLVRALRGTPPSARGASITVVRAALALADGDSEKCGRQLSRARRSVDLVAGAPDPATELSIDVVESVRACDADGLQAVSVAEETLGRIEAWRGGRPEDLTGLSVLVRTSIGVARLRRGDLAEARATLDAATAAADESDCRPLPVLAHAYLALVAALEGRLEDAHACASRSVALADRTHAPSEHRPPAAEIALAWVSAERCDLEAGRLHLARASRSRRPDPIEEGLSAVVRSRLQRGDGDVEAAIGPDAGQSLPDGAGWLSDLIAIESAETSVARGDADRALTTLAALQQPDRATALIALAHAQLARGDRAALGRTLAGPLSALGGDPRPCGAGAGVLEAAHHLHLGHRQPAKAALARALRLAAPDRLRRPFREAPAIVRDLLVADQELTARNPWLGMGGGPSPSGRVAVHAAVEDGPESLREGEIIEPLTAREREVLNHLSELLTTEEIAATMFVSVNTVRTHVRNILRKLAVSRRNEAVRRGRALSLLGT